MNIKERKLINNLPHFDIGKNQVISSGRQSTVDVNTSQFSAQGAYTGYDKAADSYTKSIVPNTINSTIGTVSTIGNMVSGFATSAAAAKAANIAAIQNMAGSSGAINTMGTTLSAADISNLSGKQAAEVVTDLGGTAANTALSAAGYIAGAAGTAYGLYNMFQGAKNFDNRLHDTDMMNGASSSIQTKFGRSYKQIGGFDEQGILNYTKAQNKADTMNMAMSGLSTGMSAGGTIGSIFGPVGFGIGAVLGGLGGFFGGSSWGDSEARERERKVRQDIANVKGAIHGQNLQAEAEAGSGGLRDMFNARSGEYTTGILRADKGKNIGNIKEGSYGKIETERGTEYGPIQGLAQPREGIVNYDVPYTHYLGSTNPNIKEERKDYIPVGSNFNFGKDFILGNKPYEGKKGNPTYADLGRNALKQNEIINQKRESGIITPEDEQIYMRNWKYLRSLGESQMRSTDNKSLLADKGKNVQKYSLGGWLKTAGKNVGNWLGKNGRMFEPLIGLGARLPYAIAESNAANSEIPYAQNSYVPNSTADSALNILGGLRYDPSAQLAEINRVAGQNRYNINNAGSLSAGQRVALSSQANNQLLSQRGQILADAYNRNAAYKQAYANALMQHGQSEAAKAQQALATQQEQYRQAVGAKQRLQEQARKNWYTIAGQTLQDWSTNSYQNKMLNLWNKQVENDKIALKDKKNKSINDAVLNTILNKTGKVEIPVHNWTPSIIQNPLGWRSFLYSKPMNERDYIYSIAGPRNVYNETN